MWSRIRSITSQLRPYLMRYSSPFSFLFTWPFQTQSESESRSVQGATKQMFTRSMWHIVRGEFPQADRELHRLLHLLAEAYAEKQIDVATYTEQRGRVCSELANVNLLLRNYSEAEALIKQTVQDCLTAGLAVSDAAIIELSLKLALIYEKLGRLDDCITGFRYCIETQERKLASGEVTDPTQLINEKALLGMSYNYFSQFLYIQKELSQALDYAKKALTLAEQLYGRTHPNCLNLQSDVVTILVDLNRLDEAQSMLDEVYRSAQVGRTEDQADIPADTRCHLLLQMVTVSALSGDRKTAMTHFSEAENICANLPYLQMRMQEVKGRFGL